MIEENVERLRQGWHRTHPRFSAAVSLVGTLCGLGFVVQGVLALAAGDRATSGVLLYLGFWALLTLICAFGAVRHIRLARDPSADDARLQAIIDQPRDQLIRKARLGFWLVSTVLVVTGVAMALLARPVASHLVPLSLGCLLVVLGIGFLTLGEKRLRDPKLYD